MDVQIRRQDQDTWIVDCGEQDILRIERDTFEERTFRLKAFSQTEIEGIGVWLVVQTIVCPECCLKVLIGTINIRVFDKTDPIDRDLLGWIQKVKNGEIELPPEVRQAHPPSSPTRRCPKDKGLNWGTRHA